MTNEAIAERKTRPWGPVVGIFTLVHVVSLVGVLFLAPTAAPLSLASIRSGQDVFYFCWLFVVPLLLEVLMVGLPLTCLVRRLEQRPLRPAAFGVAIFLFALYFLLDAGLYGMERATYKTGLLAVCFGLLLVWGYLSTDPDDV